MFNLLIVFLGIVYIVACGLLILFILMQEGKSGGLAGSESASAAPGALSDTFGAGGANKTLFNTTAWLAGIFFVLAVVLTLLGNAKSSQTGHLSLEGGETTPASTTLTIPAGDAPAAPAGDAPAAPAAPAVPAQ